MVSKYEILTDDEIILQYKINKEKERARNKEAYERLKLNKVKYIFIKWKFYNVLAENAQMVD